MPDAYAEPNRVRREELGDIAGLRDDAPNQQLRGDEVRSQAGLLGGSPRHDEILEEVGDPYTVTLRSGNVGE
jgi:hypothetical protein